MVFYGNNGMKLAREYMKTDLSIVRFAVLPSISKEDAAMPEQLLTIPLSRVGISRKRS